MPSEHFDRPVQQSTPAANPALLATNLESAITDILNAEVKITLPNPLMADGRENFVTLKPFVGGCAVVLLDGEGNIVHSLQKQVGDVFEVYGTDDKLADLIPYALTKAQGCIALHKAGCEGGVGDSRENLIFVASSRSNNGPVFLGEAKAVIDGKPYFIGVSGAGVSSEFLNLLCPGSEQIALKDRVNLFAGKIDEWFATLLRDRMQNQNSLRSMPQPDNYPVELSPFLRALILSH